MSKIRGKIVKAVKIADSDAGRIVGDSLRALRELAGLTQIQVAHRLKIGQAAISKIEGRADIHIATLKKYVEVLGSKLRIDAVVPSSTLKAEVIFDAENASDDQYIFPIFGHDLFRPQRDVVLSIHPQYSSKIIDGSKTVELRRRFPMSAPQGTIAYIYSTSPVRALVGRAEIANVVKLPVRDIWKRYSESAFIEKADFKTYFSGLDEGYAIKFANARPLKRQLELAELRERFNFEPPQSFLYASPILRRALRDEQSGLFD